MHKAALVAQIRSEQRVLERWLTRLSAEDLTRPGVMGNWSIKDLAAHLAAWESRMADYLDRLQTGQPPGQLPWGLADEELEIINRQIYGEHRDQPLAEVLNELRRAQAAVIQAVEAVPDEGLLGQGMVAELGDEPVWVVVAGNTYEHYREHTEALQLAWPAGSASQQKNRPLKRLWAVWLALVIPLIIVGAVVWRYVQGGLPDEAQYILDQYLAWRVPAGRPAVVVQKVGRAAHPENFTPALSGVTYGEGLYFYTRYTFWREEITPVNPWDPRISVEVESGAGSRPLPFPPGAVWCVTLKAADLPDPQLVYVAQHQDLFVAAWVVHEGQRDEKAARQAAAAVGCP